MTDTSLPVSAATDQRGSSERNVDRRDTYLVWIWIVCVVGITIVPYAVGYSNSDDQLIFTGHLDPYPGDYGFHLGWAKQAYDGRVLMEFPSYGNQTTTRLVINALFLLIGWTGRLLNLPLALAFQLVRIGVTVTLLLTIYHLTSHFIRERFWKWVALLLISFSSGFAWMEMLGLPVFWVDQPEAYDRLCPIDAIALESNTLWCVRWEVVTTPTILLVVAIFLMGLRFYDTGSVRYAIWAGLLALLLGMVHPHDLLTIYVTLLCYTVVFYGPRYLTGRLSAGRIPWEPWRLLLVVTALSAPTLLYYRYVLFRETALWSYVGQQEHFSPQQMLLGFGLPGGFAIYGGLQVLTRRQRNRYFLVTWLVCGLALFYIPVPPAGMVFALHGLHIAVCLLATIGLKSCAGMLNSGLERLRCVGRCRDVTLATLLILLLLVSSLTNVLAVANEIALASGHGRPPFENTYFERWIEGYRRGIGTTRPPPGDSSTAQSPYFFPRELLEAFHWLDTNSNPSDVILAPVYQSYLVPYMTGNKVHYGPSVDPIGGDHRSRFVQNQMFFDLTRNDRERLRMIQTNGIDYVLFWFTQPIDEASTKALVRWFETSLPVRAVYHNRRALILQVDPPQQGGGAQAAGDRLSDQWSTARCNPRRDRVGYVWAECPVIPRSEDRQANGISGES